MGILDKALSWLESRVKTWRLARALVQKGIGERVMSAGLLGGTTYGWPGGWSQDRIEQTMHYRHWVYISVRAIANFIAGLEPQVAHVRAGRAPSSFEQKQLARLSRLKSLQAIHEHEDVTPVGHDHPLVRLFKHPNTWDVQSSLWYELLLFLELTGNAYLWCVPNRLGLPCELWVIPSHWVWPRLDRSGIRHYEIRPFVGSGMLIFPPDEVIHLSYKSPIHKIDGWSPQTAGAEWIDAGESIDRSRFWQFKNGAFPLGALELGEQYADPDDNDLERIYAKFFARLQGEQNYGKPIITPPGAKYTPLSIAPAEMAYVDSASQLRDWVLALYQVPKEIAGIQDAGSEIAMYGPLHQFCSFCIAPKLRYLGQMLTTQLASRFGRDLRIWWDDPTPDSPPQVNADLDLDLKYGLITPNEARAIRGRQPYTPEQEEKYSGAGKKQPPAAPGAPQSVMSPPPAAGKTLLPEAIKARLNGYHKASDFDESKHPRDEDGKFGSGGGGSGGSRSDESGGKAESASAGSSGEASRYDEIRQVATSYWQSIDDLAGGMRAIVDEVDQGKLNPEDRDTARKAVQIHAEALRSKLDEAGALLNAAVAAGVPQADIDFEKDEILASAKDLGRATAKWQRAMGKAHDMGAKVDAMPEKPEPEFPAEEWDALLEKLNEVGEDTPAGEKIAAQMDRLDARYARDHDAWERYDDRRNELIEKEQEALASAVEAMGELDEALDDYESRIDTLKAIIDAWEEEESAAEEPEEEEPEEEPDDDAKSYLSWRKSSPDFDENKHPRADDGKFGSGGGGSPASGADKKPSANGTATSDKPDKPKGKRSVRERIAAVAARGVEFFRGAGHKAQHLEHVAQQFVSEGIPERIDALPGKLRPLVKGVWFLTKLATKTAFATFIAGQKAAAAVAAETGATEQERAKLAALCTTLDVAGAKAVPLGLGAVGLGAFGLAGSFVPLGSMAYLAYASVRQPTAVLRAARKAVSSAMSKRADEQKAEQSPAAQLARYLELQRQHEQAGTGEMFEACVFAALDRSKSLAEALDIADQAARKESA